MPALLLYLLKVNIALLLFCLGYYAVLRKLTFYTLNRVYLVLAIVFSTVYPKIDLSGMLQRHEKLVQPIQYVVIDINAKAIDLVKPVAQTNYWHWVLASFWVGVVLMALRLAVQFWSLAKIYKRSRPASIYDHKVRVINEEANPFSFWQSIFINPKHHGPEELRSIIAHEQVHVSQWHTLDILLAEVSLVFYWFNPGVWLMKKAVSENLEFITDRNILQQGIDAKNYQYSLLYASFNTSPNAMVNHFNISTIKKRIMMMNSKRSSAVSLTRYGFIAPAALALLLVFGTTKAELIKRSFKKASTATSQALETLSIAINEEKTQPETLPAKEELRKDAVKLMMNQAGLSQQADAIAQRMNITPDTPKINLAFRSRSDSALYVIDDKPVTKAEFSKLDLNNLESVHVLKDESATRLFGDAGKHGVVFLVTYDGVNVPEVKDLLDKMQYTPRKKSLSLKLNRPYDTAATKPTGYYTPAGSDKKIPIYGNERQILGTFGSPRLYGNIDSSKLTTAYGERITKLRINGRTLTTTKSDSLKDISVIGYASRSKNKDLKEVTINGYGTKATTVPAGRAFALRGTLSGANSPIFVLDGKPATNDQISNLMPNTIERINVLKDTAATSLYGKKAVNGVIIITTKRPTKKP